MRNLASECYGFARERRIWIGGLSVCDVAIGVSRSLSMRHARKPIVFNAATSRERSDRVVDG